MSRFRASLSGPPLLGPAPALERWLSGRKHRIRNPASLSRPCRFEPTLSATGHDPAGRRDRSDKAVRRGSIPRWPTIPPWRSGQRSGLLLRGPSVRIGPEGQAPLAQRTERPASTRHVGGSSPSRRTQLRWRKRINSPGPQPGDCRFEPGTAYARHAVVAHRVEQLPSKQRDGVRVPAAVLRGADGRGE